MTNEMPLQVEVRWDPHVVPHLKPEAVPGLVQGALDAMFPGAFVEVTALVAMPEEQKSHLPGCDFPCCSDKQGVIA